MTRALCDASARPLRVVSLVLLAGALAAFGSPRSDAQVSAPARAAVRTATVEQGVPWRELKPSQQDALRPLETEWDQIGPAQKQKWLELSGRLPKMTPAQRSRVRERMASWAKLTPQERGQARLRYQEAKQVPLQDRRDRWNTYQSLSPEQKQDLAERASPVTPAERQTERLGTASRRSPQTRSNVAPNPARDATPKAIGPTVLQARPGATTTPITKRPTPPWHQQTGLPKIAATPEFVDQATLLPRRGPQGAATRPAGGPVGAGSSATPNR